DVMPIRRLYRTAAPGTHGLAEMARPIGPLLAGRRIVVLDNLLGFQVREFLIALIAQEDGLAAVAHEHERIMRNFQLVHYSGLLALPSRYLNIFAARRCRLDSDQLPPPSPEISEKRRVQ